MTLKNYKSNLKTKNLKIAIAATGLLLATNETFAQTSLERSKIKENINQVTLDTLKLFDIIPLVFMLNKTTFCPEMLILPFPIKFVFPSK